jgi:ubiquinone/menaquinone biosynthesis C-methylase UbiE
VEFIGGDVQKLPFEDGSFDTVVATLLFCSVADPMAGLRELRRVLKPGGSYLFIEHVRPRGRSFAGLADLATPLWRRIAGGCHLNRDTEAAIREAGFSIDHGCDYARGVFVGGIARSA